MDKGRIFKRFITFVVIGIVAFCAYYFLLHGIQTVALKKFTDADGSEKLNISTTHYFISLSKIAEIPQLEVYLIENAKNTKIYMSRSEIWGCIEGEYSSYNVQRRKVPTVAFIPITLSNSSDWDLSYFIESGEVSSCGGADLSGQTSIPNYVKKEIEGEKEVLFVFGKTSKQMIVSK